jgi:acetyl esterase/lipase
MTQFREKAFARKSSTLGNRLEVRPVSLENKRIDMNRIGLGLWMVVAATFCGCMTPESPTRKESEPRLIELWPGGAPGAKGTSDEDRPALLAYLPEGNANGAAILICPGGGFTIRCTDHEGVQAARWFQSRGVAAFILRYRVVPLYTVRESLLDTQRGVQYLRGHATEFGISPNRIGTMGFSAGAHLAGVVGMKPAPAASGKDSIEAVSSRPDFMVLAYGDAGQTGRFGGIGAYGLTPEERPRVVPSETELTGAPPTFLFCTSEDVGHAVGMNDLYGRLLRAKVPVEAHFFQNGDHGVGMALGDRVLGKWPNVMWLWLGQNGFLSKTTRTAIEGIVTLDGKPLPRGYVIFRNENDSGVGYVFNTGPVPGYYEIPASRGLPPGKYTVEIRQDAARWMSNSRDPIFQEISAKLRNGGGKLEKADEEKWIASARKKDFSPTLPNQRVFLTRTPSDSRPLEVEVLRGSRQVLDFEIKSQ